MAALIRWWHRGAALAGLATAAAAALAVAARDEPPPAAAPPAGPGGPIEPAGGASEHDRAQLAERAARQALAIALVWVQREGQARITARAACARGAMARAGGAPSDAAAAGPVVEVAADRPGRFRFVGRLDAAAGAGAAAAYRYACTAEESRPMVLRLEPER